MRAIVIYSRAGRMESLAESVAKGLRSGGATDVEVMAADQGGPVISVGAYDLICVGSPVVGRFGGKVTGDIEAALKRCSRLSGKQGAAFVMPRLLGTTKGVRTLMGLLEHQGVQVRDFDTVSSSNQAEAFGRRLVFDPRG